MKVISKTIENDSGVNVSCWVAVNGKFNLEDNLGTVQLLGYKDTTAFTNGKSHLESKTVSLSLSDIEGFETMWQTIANKIITTGDLNGGSIVDA